VPSVAHALGGLGVKYSGYFCARTGRSSLSLIPYHISLLSHVPYNTPHSTKLANPVVVGLAGFGLIFGGLVQLIADFQGVKILGASPEALQKIVGAALRRDLFKPSRYKPAPTPKPSQRFGSDQRLWEMYSSRALDD